MLSAHYRSPLNFSDELMEGAKNGLERILNCVDSLNYLLENNAASELTKEEEELLSSAKVYIGKFEDAMDDDFNTADAISAIFELVKFANTNISDTSSKAVIKELLSYITKLCDVLGIITKKEKEVLDSDIEALIEERQAARKEKNFARADEIRDQLLSMGIVLEDTREGVKWKRA
jgi:cysteinyl-tRNA synthetase